MEEERYKVPLFDGNNYHSWKFRMEVLLDELDLLEHIENPLKLEEVKETGKDEIEKRNEKKMKNDKLCKRKIVSKVSDSHLEYLQGKKTAYDMWISLKNSFERQSLASQHRLKRQLESLKAHPRESLTSHFLNFEKLVREYKSAGGTLTEKETVLQLFQSLPNKEYQTVISSLETLSIADPSLVTLPVVKGRLLDEEAKLLHAVSSRPREESNSSVFIANRKEKFNNRGTPKSLQQLNKPANSKESSVKSMANERFHFKCHFCNKPGHKKADCWKRAKWMERSNSNQANSAGTAAQNKEADFCFKTEESGCSGEDFVYTSSNVNKCNVKWCLDSGASEHLINSEKYVSNVKELPEPIKIKVAKSGQHLVAKNYGSMLVESKVNNKSLKVKIDNILIVPDLEVNLMSVRRLEMNGFTIIFKAGKAEIKHGSTVVATAHRKNKLYELDFEISDSSLVDGANLTEANLWHRRLGHISNQSQEKLKGMVEGMSPNIKQGKLDQSVCEICVSGKQTKLPHNKTRTRATRPLQLVHSDIMGPINCHSWNNKRYILCFVDDFTHFTCVYFLEFKSEAFRYFKIYEAMATAHFNLPISRFRCDRGGEYLSREMKDYFEERGIQYECSISHTPQQNGVSERMNRTIAEKARCMLLESNLSKTLWNEAVLSAVYIINRSPTSALNNCVPAELWYGKKPDLSKLRVFGCLAFLHPPKSQIKGKFDSQTIKCYMVGYCHNGYRLWYPEKQKVIEGRDIIFDENKFVCKNQQTNWESDSELSEIDTNNGENILEGEPNFTVNENKNQYEESRSNKSENEENPGTVEQLNVRRTSRLTRAPTYLNDYMMYSDLAVFALNAESFVEDVPIVYEDINTRHDKTLWDAAVKEELRALEENDTWSLCQLPPGRKPIDNKWVFKIKRNAEGEVDKYKARLVIKGCCQKKGLDYNDTYAPVARMNTFRILLSVVNANDLYCEQLDVNNAFLNGELTEDIYMKQPQGLEDGSDRVCKLNKALYGLKQAPKAWNAKFHGVVTRLGFNQSKNDSCLYVKKSENGYMYLLVYVDDIILAGNNIASIECVKSELKSNFRTKDLGQLSYFLGMKVTKTESGLFLSNETYLRNVLNRFEMSDCKPVSTPLEVNPPRELEGPCIVGLKPYRELIGCLMYAALSTRPDLSFAVNFYSRFQANATEVQWKGLKRVLRYIRGTLDFGLFFKNRSLTTIVGYADADWANDTDRKSISGYMFEVFGGVVSWCSKKQNSVALSSTEAEYVALCLAGCELVWIKNLLAEMFIQVQSPVTLYEDNMSCIHQLDKPDHSKQKHIDVKYHYIKELVKKKEVEVTYVSSKEQKADILTKGLVATQFYKLRTGLGVLPMK